jgi:hypothetical protein
MSNSKTHKYTGNAIGKRPNVARHKKDLAQVSVLLYLSAALIPIMRVPNVYFASTRTHQRTFFGTLCQWIWRGSVLLWLLFIRGMTWDSLRNNRSVTRSTTRRFVKNCDMGVSPRSSIFCTFQTMAFLDNKKMTQFINYNVPNTSRILYVASLCWTTYFGGWHAYFLCEILEFKMATVVAQVAILMIVQELSRLRLQRDGTRA